MIKNYLYGQESSNKIDRNGFLSNYPIARFNFLNCRILFLLSFFLTSESFPQEKTIYNSINPPAGYVRETFPEGSYSNWIQHLPIKENNIIFEYRGYTISRDYFYSVFGVVDMPLLFHSDLEQCADYCMRFWAEYHKDMNRLDSLYLFDYSGNKKRFKDSEKTYLSFLKWAFSCSNSYSLKRGCKKVSRYELIAGDMIVQNEGGGIGHASVILDVCKSQEGKKLYLIGYSFMPAQEFHIEKAASTRGTEGWFTIQGYFEYLSAYLPLGEPVLMRFESSFSIEQSSRIIDKWDYFEKAVRDQKILKDSAKKVFPSLYEKLKQYADKFKFDTLTSPWTFPVNGYGIESVGKGGFKPDIYYGGSSIKGYNFYDGNKHGGHPAYDLFILDKNQDCLDDSSGKPVNIIAPVDLMILSVFKDWVKGSGIRGGNYVWALNPLEDQIFYFAHLDSILVKGGDFCKEGTSIGTVGRSGKNAWVKRCPTHLHMMVLKIDGTELTPVDYLHLLE